MSSAPASAQPSFDATDDQRAQEEEAEELKDAASTLLSQLIYNGEVLDISLDALKSYKPGTQSLMYLDGSVGLAYSLLRFALLDSVVDCLLINTSQDARKMEQKKCFRRRRICKEESQQKEEEKGKGPNRG